MNLSLREATQNDLPLMMAWRNQVQVYSGFYTQHEPLRWEEHLNWFNSRNKDWRTFIIMYEDRPVGVVTIGQLDHWCPEIGFYVGEVALWGKGIGKEAVRLGLDWIRQYGREYCHTTVKKDNKRAIRLLESLGFQQCGVAREGEVWMRTAKWTPRQAREEIAIIARDWKFTTDTIEGGLVMPECYVFADRVLAILP